MKNCYLCIDLKSFYASVECVERGLDPMTTDLVVADPERSNKTICLAVSPHLKSLGVKNRCRIFEIPDRIGYIMAPPRMQKYIEYSVDIYKLYLRYFAPEDIYIYSIDECFLNVGPYLNTYEKTPKEMAVFLMDAIKNEIGVRSTAGIGTNLYLAKIALDIMAKHSPDFIGILDEESFKKELWDHTPLTDFWRIGKGISDRLKNHGIYTMRDIANAPEDILYCEFGIDAELMIDHAWGKESCTMADIKAFKPKNNSLSSGQVLMRDYSFEEGKIIVKEMCDLLCLELTKKKMYTSSLSLYIGYSNSLRSPAATGTAGLKYETCSSSVLMPLSASLYERITDRTKPIRRINIGFNAVRETKEEKQVGLFDAVEEIDDSKDAKLQGTINSIKERYGKSSILKGMNYQEAATTRERNEQIGGHKRGK